MDFLRRKKVNNVKMDVLSIILILSFVLPILKGIIKKYSPENLKREIMIIIKLVTFGGSLLLGFYLCKRFILYNDNDFFTEYLYDFIGKYANIVNEKPLIIYLLAAPILAGIIYMIFVKLEDIFFGIILFPLLERLSNTVEESNSFVKRFLGLILSIPKAIIFPILISSCIYVYNVSFSTPYIEKITYGSQIHKEISQNVIVPFINNEFVSNIPNLFNESFRIDIDKVEDVFTENMIVYYNGVTMEEGIESSSEIDLFTTEICEEATNDTAKALIIYNWIIENISYDDEKAKKILEDDLDSPSGAVQTFSKKNGVCFDFACLFVAMARSQDLSVRMVAGKGYNGKQWVDHSWNEVYITKENRWIKIDTTFGLSDYYFDNELFDDDHDQRRVIGEWIEN